MLWLCTPVAYSRRVRFIETSTFTKRIVALLSDAEYSRLQRDLLQNPRAGKVIQGTGGLRKMRWGDESRHRGKRGGARIIYYWYQPAEEFFMLLAFSKDEQEELTLPRRESSGSSCKRSSRESQRF